MEHTAVFSDSTLKFNSLQTEIPVGSDVAVFVEAQSRTGSSSAIAINGEEFRIASGTSGSQHGWKILRGVSTVQIRGRGFSNTSEFAAPPRIFTIEIR